MKKSILRPLGLISLFIVMIGCEKENFEPNLSKKVPFSAYYTTFDQLSNQTEVKGIINKIHSKNKHPSNIAWKGKRDVYDSIGGFTIHTDKILKIISGEKHWLTFAISRSHKTDTLENLVLRWNAQTQNYDGFIFNYLSEMETLPIFVLVTEEYTAGRPVYEVGDQVQWPDGSCWEVMSIMENGLPEWEEIACSLMDGGGGGSEGPNNSYGGYFGVPHDFSNPGDTGDTTGGGGTGGDLGEDTTIYNPPPMNGHTSVIMTGPILVPTKKEDCNTSKDDLKTLFPNASDSDMQILADVLNDYGEDFGIDTAPELQHFLAQAGHETGGFTTLNVTESTYWTTASLLAATYSRFTMDSLAAVNDSDLYYAPDYLQDSQGVANVAMCCRYGNGDVASGDGYKYRGRGIFQLTWYTNYSAFKIWYNKEYDPDLDFVANPSLIAQNDTLSILSGLWYFKERVLDKKTITSSTSADVATELINKYTDSYQERRDLLSNAEIKIKCK